MNNYRIMGITGIGTEIKLLPVNDLSSHSWIVQENIHGEWVYKGVYKTIGHAKRRLSNLKRRERESKQKEFSKSPQWSISI